MPYEQFTQRALKVLKLANEQALRQNRESIAPEHLLFGIVEEGSGVASCVIKNLHVELHKIRREVEKLMTHRPDSPQRGKLPMSPEAKQVIDQALQESTSLNHGYVGTEHLLVGMFGNPLGAVAQILVNLGLSPVAIRAEIQKLLTQPIDRHSFSAGPPAPGWLSFLR